MEFQCRSLQGKYQICHRRGRSHTNSLSVCKLARNCICMRREHDLEINICPPHLFVACVRYIKRYNKITVRVRSCIYNDGVKSPLFLMIWDRHLRLNVFFFFLFFLIFILIFIGNTSVISSLALSKGDNCLFHWTFANVTRWLSYLQGDSGTWFKPRFCPRQVNLSKIFAVLKCCGWTQWSNKTTRLYTWIQTVKHKRHE